MKSFQFLRHVNIHFQGGCTQKFIDTKVDFEGGVHTGVPLPIVDLGDGMVAVPNPRSATIDGEQGIFLSLNSWGFSDLVLGLTLPLSVSGDTNPAKACPDLIQRYKQHGRGRGRQFAYDWMSGEVAKLVKRAQAVDGSVNTSPGTDLATR